MGGLMDPLAKSVVRKFIAQAEACEACEMSEANLERAPAEEPVAVAPPGWEGPVKEMKKDKDIDNPWALAWHMKNKGDKPHKEGTLAERVVARHIQALDDAAAKRTPKVKMPDLSKVKDTLDKLVFAVKVLLQRKDDNSAKREVERHMNEYTAEVRAMGDALNKAMPKDAGKERERAQELFDKINFFTRPTMAHAMVSGQMTVEALERDFPKAMTIWRELEQLLKGQMVLLANVLAARDYKQDAGKLEGEARTHYEHARNLGKKMAEASKAAGAAVQKKDGKGVVKHLQDMAKDAEVVAKDAMGFHKKLEGYMKAHGHEEAVAKYKLDGKPLLQAYADKLAAAAGKVAQWGKMIAESAKDEPPPDQLWAAVGALKSIDEKMRELQAYIGHAHVTLNGLAPR